MNIQKTNNDSHNNDNDSIELYTINTQSLSSKRKNNTQKFLRFVHSKQKTFKKCFSYFSIIL